MELLDSPSDAIFREEARSWLADNLVGEFAGVPADGIVSDDNWEIRLAWEKKLGEGGWIGLGWPTEYGGQGASLTQEVIFATEYAAANAPTRISTLGEGLLGPTLILLGSDEQRARFLPPILRGEEMWCQGYSEPDAGSDLANINMRGELHDDGWHLNGQKVWTTVAHRADWCFVLCRTQEGSERHRGISYMLVPMRQPGITVRPLRQLTGTNEFGEVFFDDAITAVDNVVGEPHAGWRVAMATLGFERVTATAAGQLGFRREFWDSVNAARDAGKLDNALTRDRFARAFCGLEIMRYNSLRMLAAAGSDDAEDRVASVAKLYWSTWHRDFAELALNTVGSAALLLDDGEYEPTREQRSFLFSRAETIYAGTSEIQKNLIAERALGLPR